LKVEQILSNHTTVGYQGTNGVNLPESYNGLGPRNLIFMLLKLFEFFKAFQSSQPTSGVHLIFIEEPEAHLHPQMQNVFIRKLEEIRDLFAAQYNNGAPWPVQFVVTTHSSHIANEATFDSMRYFLAQPRETGSNVLKTEIKDLRTGLSGEIDADREFLHKYLTLTRCDLLFADRAILVEGTTERLLLPGMIKKYDDSLLPENQKLGSKYLSIMEVGGAYAHLFFNLLDFLNLRSLVITDLDTVDKNDNRKKCRVSVGTHSSNACINNWYTPGKEDNLTKDALLAKTEDEKLSESRRLAFQIPHAEGDACGRSFEDAFMLANPGIFEITGATPEERELQAWDKAVGVDKTDFAMEFAILKTEWVTPSYIDEGLCWLAAGSSPATEGDTNA
jgi:predicted ATP-dependent endonuclease of OLD family